VEVCRIAEERLGTREASRLRVVALEVGQDAGLEADNLAFCLEALLAQPPFGNGRPIIDRVPGDDLRINYLEVDDGRPDD
jgi:Zn finger protein HypA/HybF involved in hydrogenase expression